MSDAGRQQAEGGHLLLVDDTRLRGAESVGPLLDAPFQIGLGRRQLAIQTLELLARCVQRSRQR